MKVTWNWLAEFVEMEMPLPALVERLTMAGLEVESVDARGRELSDVRCAEIVEVRAHPHAERLSVCAVRVGADGVANVVCGAPNVRAGERVAYAPPGAMLPGGRRMEATEIRGVASAGMLCSEAELGIGADASGILVLPSDAAIGASVSALLGLEDTVLDIAITPNRGDCLSVLGIAREIAALTGQRLRRQRVAVRESDVDVAGLIAIRILDDDLCARYVGRVIDSVRIAPSPLWLQYRLRAVSMRPINNVVDITNYVMIERGQPLHAFDYDRLPNREIVVRRAGADATFATLDEQSRALQADDLLITTGAHPVAIAGVMGGADSEVTDQTRRVLLESAWFAPGAVRRTAKRLGLRTEASYRFERCTDIEGVPVAADRAAGLIAKLAGGVVARGRVDAYPSVRPTASIALRLKRVDDLLGMTVARADVIGKLKALGMGVAPAARGNLTVTPPSYRSDVTREIDLIEEIVRLVGYENVPISTPEIALASPVERVDLRRQRSVKRFLAALGLSEAVSLSFCSPRLNELFPGLVPGRPPVRVRNPLTQDDSQLRLSLCPGLVRAVRDNLAQGVPAVALFSLGKVFWRTDTFAEAPRLAGVICPALPGRGLGRQVTAEFADAKGIVEGLFDFLGVGEARWFPAGDLPTLHPGKTARIVLRDTPIGILGALHPDVADELGINGPCWLFELDLDHLLQYCPARIIFKDLPRFPAVVRDVAVVTESDFAADQVIQFVRQWTQGAAWIEDVHLFDEYVGPQVATGKKSLAYTISYRAPDRTLTDAEVNEMHAELITALQHALHVEPR